MVITAERDVRRSQGEEFALHLETAGVAVIATRYDGVMHEFFGAAAVLDQAQDAQLEAAMHLRMAFGTGSTFDPYPTGNPSVAVTSRQQV